MIKISTILKILIVIEFFLLFYKYIPPHVGNKLETLILPGFESNNIEYLHPQMQERVKAIVKSLNKSGFQPRIYTTYRSAEMQDFYYSVSSAGKVLGIPAMTRARGGQSCHNKKNKAGLPASTAVDIWGKPYGAFLSLRLDINFNQHIRFFKALGVVVKEHGLEWGGRWTSQHSVWTQYDLGWDPAHIQMGRCN